MSDSSGFRNHTCLNFLSSRNGCLGILFGSSALCRALAAVSLNKQREGEKGEGFFFTPGGGFAPFSSDNLADRALGAEFLLHSDIRAPAETESHTPQVQPSRTSGLGRMLGPLGKSASGHLPLWSANDYIKTGIYSLHTHPRDDSSEKSGCCCF